MPLDYDLTYAGVPFCLDMGRKIRLTHQHHPYTDTPQTFPQKFQPLVDLVDEIDRLIPFRHTADMGLPTNALGKDLADIAKQQHLGNPDREVKIGEWYYPNTMRTWSVFRGLATSSQAAEMLRLVGGSQGSNYTPATFKMYCQPDGPFQGGAASYTVQTQMYLLPPRPLAEHGGSFDGLYLITLVDDRYWLQYAPVSLLSLTKDTTWTDLIDAIASAMGVTVSYSAVDAAYGKPEIDSQLWAPQENGAVLLDAVAASLGRTVVRNLDGTYRVQTNAEALAAANANRGAAGSVVRAMGGDMFNAQVTLPAGDLTKAKKAVLPDTVRVTFPKYVLADPVPHFLNPRYTGPQRPSAWYEDSYGDLYVENVPLASGGTFVSGIAGVPFTHCIHTTAKALYSGEANAGGDPLNVSGIRSLSMAIAESYYEGQVYTGLDEVYPGTYLWSPEGLHTIVWRYTSRGRQATCRVIRDQWNQMTCDMQHATPPVSGFTGVPVGVGGPSVAQTWSDSFSGAVQTTLNQTLLSGDFTASLASIEYFPTQNRWRGQINGERILFEGTSGGAVSGTLIGIVYRGIDGTIQQQQDNGATVSQVTPDAAYGINYVHYEKNQFIYPSDWTSGGVQGADVVPQVQSVQVLDTVGKLINGVYHFSGIVKRYNTLLSGPSTFISGEMVWVIPRISGAAISSGEHYGGNLVGYSASGAVAPVYLIDPGGGSGGGGSAGAQSILMQLTGKDYSGTVFDGGSGFTPYSWIQVFESGGPSANPPHLYYDHKSGAVNSLSGGTCRTCVPAYHVQNQDVPTFPFVPFLLSGSESVLSGGAIVRQSIVRAWKGSGDYYLFDQMPWIDLFNRTDAEDSYGVIGYHRVWNQGTGQWMDGTEVRIRPAQ